MSLNPCLDDAGNPDPDYWDCFEVSSIDVQQKLVKRGWLHSIPTLDKMQRLLLATQAWYDWKAVGHRRKRTKAFWTDCYGVDLSRGSIERATQLLSSASSDLVDLVWQSLVTLKAAAMFSQVCPHPHQQRALITAYGLESFIERLHACDLPCAGMLKLRIKRILVEYKTSSDHDLAKVISRELVRWREQLKEFGDILDGQERVGEAV